MKPNILFVHAVCPAQFSDLCEYLNTTGTANAYYMTTPGNIARNKHRYRNLIPLMPVGNMMAPNSCYYSGKVERAGKVSAGLFRGLKKIINFLRIDIIVAHGSWASPHLIFDEFDIPIITYIEFPSYADHGWDAKYPPTEAQRLTDKNMQMLSYYQVMKSQQTIVPSEHAKKMFPRKLQSSIVVQFEGFDLDKIAQREPANIQLPKGVKTIGFAARDLSSAKGLEVFIKTAEHLSRSNQKIHFVVIGNPEATTYGYEGVFLEKEYGKGNPITFIDHLFKTHKLNRKHFTLTGKLPYPEYSDLLHKIDLFLYPVQYGSGNWGLLELLIRGCTVIASNRCYVNEIIDHNVNGILINSNDPQEWANSALAVLGDDAQRTALGKKALEMASDYYLPAVSKQYMKIFTETIQRHKKTTPP